MKYYIITGLDNGEAIKPYLLKGDNLDMHLYCFGDRSRFYWVFDNFTEANEKLNQLLKGNL